MKIAIGTTSELKARALKNALDKLEIKAEIMPTKIDSGISKQPFGYKEMVKGAKNRAEEAFKKTHSDLVMGVENGLVDIEGNFFDIACAYIISKNGEESVAFSSGIFIPKWMIDEIKEKDTEVGEITKRLSGDNEKDGFKYFSNGAIRREESLSQAILLALVKIFNREKYLKP